jgi:hypothetical protein
MMLIHKWGLHHRFRRFCFFCFGFWLCVVFTIALTLVAPVTVTQFIVIPIMASVIAHKMQSDA